MPLRVAVPSPLSVKVTPAGSRWPVVLKMWAAVIGVGVGLPVVVTVNVPAWPTVNAVRPALVMAASWLTVRVRICVARLPALSSAVMLRV